MRSWRYRMRGLSLQQTGVRGLTKIVPRIDLRRSAVGVRGVIKSHSRNPH